MAVKFSNNAVTTLSADISAGATSFTVASASTFPTLGASDWTYVSLTSEVVKVTAISGTTFTCDATSGAHASGESVELRMTAEILNDVALGDDESLDAISNASAITGNAVDVFIYDTSNDSDGGAWRKRTQATSWYNETLNTSTRGSRKEFPSVAVIVAEADTLTIYDGDTPDLDMWMVFNGQTASSYLGYNITTRSLSSVVALNGAIHTGALVGNWVTDINFITELGTFWGILERGYTHTAIVNRNTSVTLTQVSTLDKIVNGIINDVAVTVLPNAPIDSATGLPIPTIAVATNGGVSVIKDDGTVVDITGLVAVNIALVGSKGWVATSWNVSAAPSDRYYVYNIPANDQTYSDTYLFQYAGNASIPATSQRGSNAGFLRGAVFTDKHLIGASYWEAGSNEHPSLVYLTQEETQGKQSVAYLTSTYNSGYMTGDIKGAWLSDTDTTSLTAIAFTDNFDTATNWPSLVDCTIAAGDLVIADAGSARATSGNWGGVTGNQYIIKVNVTATTGTVRLDDDGVGAGLGGTTTYFTTSGVGIKYFHITRTASPKMRFIRSSGTTTITDVEIRNTVPDRSVKTKGIGINGTITKTPVATGADLVAYSGFSSSNYLQHTASTNYGSAAVISFMCWVKTTNISGYQYVGSLIDGTNGNLLGLSINKSSASNPGRPYLYDSVNGSLPSSSGPRVDDGAWHCIVGVLDGTSKKLYIDGVLNTSSTGTALAMTNVTNTNVGVYIATVGGAITYPHLGSVALLRISATAPTAAQIKEIYNAEKPLFQENAKCTLNGTSDAVQCLAYDDSTSELVVGTSSSLSVFKGLRRVDEELGNFTEVSQQGGMRIVEKA